MVDLSYANVTTHPEPFTKSNDAYHRALHLALDSDLERVGALASGQAK